MNSYNFEIPQTIIFDTDGLTKLGELLTEQGFSKILLVSDLTLKSLGIVSRITNILDNEGIKYCEFLDIEANPSIETVDKGTKVFKDSKSQAIVALGGGSPMDVAKAIGLLAMYGGNITDYEGAHKVPGEIVPLIAIPTTAGTGSEVTAFSVINDKTRNYKLTVFSYELIPKYALLDPTLIMSLPFKVAASTGIDALIHAIEAYLSKAASPFSDAMAEKAIELIGSNIKHFVADRSNQEAASAMLTASTLAGIAFAWARLGNVHAMSHPLSGFFNIPHGVANAILLPTVLEYNALADSGKYRKIYQLITDLNPQDFNTEMLVSVIKELLEQLGIPKNLKSVGVTEDKIPEMSIDAMKSGNILVNPRASSIDDIRQLYFQALG